MSKIFSALRWLVRRWLGIACLSAWCVVGWALWSAQAAVPRARILDNISKYGPWCLSSGGHLVTAAKDGFAFWDTGTGGAYAKLNTESCGFIAVSPDGKSAMTQWFQLVLWDTSTAKKKMTLPHDGGTQAGAFSADGQAFATVGVQGDVELWDLTKETKTLVVPPVNSSSKPTAHGFSPDGQTLACAAPDSRNASYFTTPLALCDRWTGQQRLLIDTPAKIGLGDALAFSPDSKMLATGAFAVRLLDVATGKELAVYQPGDWNDALAFSRDGKILAVSYGRLQSQYRVLGPAIGWKWASWLFPREEQTVLLDVATGRRLSVLPRARKLAFLPDGKSLVTWWDEVEGPVLLWDVPPRMAFRPQLAWRSLLVATVTTGIWWSVRRRKRIRPAAARGNALLRQAVEQGTI